MLFLDANIFLEVELGDERSESCKKLLEKIGKSQIDAVTSDFIVYTCLIQIERKSKSVEKMEKFVLFLDNMEGLDVHSPTYKTLKNTFGTMKKYSIDFDDALVVSTMNALKIDRLVSFDSDFDKVKEIMRIDPEKALEESENNNNAK